MSALFCQLGGLNRKRPKDSEVDEGEKSTRKADVAVKEKGGIASPLAAARNDEHNSVRVCVIRVSP